METHRQFIERLLDEFGVYKPEYADIIAKMPVERRRAFYLKWVQDADDDHVRINLDFEEYGDFYESMNEAFNDFIEIDWNTDTAA